MTPTYPFTIDLKFNETIYREKYKYFLQLLAKKFFKLLTIRLIIFSLLAIFSAVIVFSSILNSIMPVVMLTASVVILLNIVDQYIAHKKRMDIYMQYIEKRVYTINHFKQPFQLVVTENDITVIGPLKEDKKNWQIFESFEEHKDSLILFEHKTAGAAEILHKSELGNENYELLKFILKDKITLKA